MKTILEEIPGYFTLLIRKSFKVRAIETIVFLFLIVVLRYRFGVNVALFKIGAVISFLLTLGFSPVFYRIFVNPKYTLTETELIVKKFSKEYRVPLIKVDTTHDLKYFFYVNDKKTPLSVSDDFIDRLVLQLAKVKKKSKK